MGFATLTAAAVALLAGCGAPLTDPEDSRPPPPDRELSVELEFLTPEGLVSNPVTLAVAAPEEVATVRYLSGLVSSLGESDDRETDFGITVSFVALGERRVEAWGFDADGGFVGDGAVDLDVRPDPDDPNDFGLWIDPASVALEPDELADRLAGLGVSRAYLKVAEGAQDCAASPTLCDAALTDALRSAGVQPWAWMVPTLDPSLPQAGILFEAIPAGYQGLVLHVDGRWAGLDEELSLLGLDFNIVRGQCDTTSEHLQGEFPIYASVTDAPESVDRPAAAIAARVDAVLVRVGEDGSGGVSEAVCALRDAGVARPVFPLLPRHADGDAWADGGRFASLWAAPPGDDAAGWAELGEVDWHRSEFGEPVCP